MAAMPDATVTRLGAVSVLAPDGSAVALGSLWADRPILLVMMRHFGCIFCKEQAGELTKLAGRIHAAGGELVILGNGLPEHAAWFVEDYHVTTPVFTDPDLVSQRMVGARSRGRLDPRVLLRAGDAFRKGYRQTKTMGPATRLGGVFVLTPEGEMPFRYLSAFAGDHPKPEIAVQALEAACRAATRA
jgi:hypothetical protein